MSKHLSAATECDALHLGCGQNHHADAWNVDNQPSCDPDELVDLEELPWPWPDGSFVEIRAHHVVEHLADITGALEEIARVLKPGGVAHVTVPMGLDAVADPDHIWGESGQPWTWRTPVFLCGARHWDADVGLEVAHREVDVWSMRPGGRLRDWQTRLWRWRLTHNGPGPWCFDLQPMSGEFHVRFRRGEP